MGQVREFGGAPNSTAQLQNIFERVLSCTCTSSPIVVRQFILWKESHTTSAKGTKVLAAAGSFCVLVLCCLGLRLFLRRVIQRLLKLEAAYLRSQGGVIYCFDQLWILQQLKKTLLLDQLDNLRIIAQGHDLWIFG